LTELSPNFLVHFFETQCTFCELLFYYIRCVFVTANKLFSLLVMRFQRLKTHNCSNNCPRVRNDLAFPVAALRLWNGLPSNLRQSDLTPQQFRRALFGWVRLQHLVTFCL